MNYNRVFRTQLYFVAEGAADENENAFQLARVRVCNVGVIPSSLGEFRICHDCIEKVVLKL